MNLCINKKATVIYRANKPFLCFFVFLFCTGLLAQTDLNSYCFEESVNLQSVQNSISFLLLPKDTVHLREDDHCIDLVLSGDRGKLFEKFLSGRYNLKREKSSDTVELPPCQLVLRTTVKQASERESVKLGEKNSVNKAEISQNSTSSMSMVLSQGVAGEMEVWPEKLQVTCRMTGANKAELKFNFSDRTKGGIANEFVVTKGEWLNIGSVVKDLHDKNKTLGIPQTVISNTTGKSETQYDLQIRQ